MKFLVQFLTAGVLMAVIDSVWLGVVANKFYKGQIGSLLLDKPNVPAAIAFYFIYVFGIVTFVLRPALEANSVSIAALYGALFGFVAYATYDLTNLSTLKGFTTKLAVIDLVWGTVLTAVVATSAFWFIKLWGF